jgi:hypothetical protein
MQLPALWGMLWYALLALGWFQPRPWDKVRAQVYLYSPQLAKLGGIMHTIVAAALAYLVGVFTPAVSRKVKSFFSAEGKKAEVAVTADVKAEVSKVEADAKAELKKL